MQFGTAKTGNTRRQLRTDRDLQEDGAGAAEFELDFEVNKPKPEPDQAPGPCRLESPRWLPPLLPCSKK